MFASVVEEKKEKSIDSVVFDRFVVREKILMLCPAVLQLKLSACDKLSAY